MTANGTAEAETGRSAPVIHSENLRSAPETANIL